MTGRPKPRELKALQGTLRPDRLKPRPKMRSGVVRCPPGQPDDVRKLFAWLVRELQPSGMLQPAYIPLILQWATAEAYWRRAAQALAEEGLFYAEPAHPGRLAKHPAHQMMREYMAIARQCAGLFGLSPVDRERISAPMGGEEEDNPLAAIVGRSRANTSGG